MCDPRRAVLCEAVRNASSDAEIESARRREIWYRKERCMRPFLGARCSTLVGLAGPSDTFFARKERRAKGETPTHLSLLALKRPTGSRHHFTLADFDFSSASLGVLAASSAFTVAALDM